MINNAIIKSIFSNYCIEKVIFLEEENSNTFIICSMNESISLDRWNNLENVLTEYTKKKNILIAICTSMQLFGQRIY